MITFEFRGNDFAFNYFVLLCIGLKVRIFLTLSWGSKNNFQKYICCGEKQW